MTNFHLPRTAALLLIAAFGLLLGGCAAERPAMKSIEPDWTHHDAGQELTSSNEAVWDRFAASRVLVSPDASQVARARELQSR